MIMKFQQGGALPLVSYTPVIISGGEQKVSQSSNSNSKKGEDLTDKDLLEMIGKLKGLPNESRAIVNSLRNFFIADPDPDSASIASRYLSTLGQIQIAAFNLDQFDKAQTSVTNKDGLNEVAITNTGQLIGLDADGDFKLLSPEQALKSNFKILTNYEVLQYRAYDQNLSFDTNLLNVVNNGIGISYVNELIQKEIDKLKSTSKTEEGYFSSNYLIQGIDQLKQAMSEGNQDLEYIYKYKITNKNQQQQIQEVLKYIYKTLPQNVITLLKYKSNGTEEGVFNLLAQFVGSQHGIESSIELDLQKNKDGEIQTKTSKSSKFELGPVGQLLADFGQKSNITIQTPGGNQWGINLNTTKHPITDKEGNSIGISTLDNVAKSAFAGALNFENVSMGGAIIDSAALSKVKINGTELHTGYVPIDVKRYHETGDIVPNYELLEKFDKVNKELEGVTDPDIINRRYVKEGLPLMYDEDGNIIITNYVKFGMINGVALSTAFKENVALSPYVTEVMDENEGNSAMRIINKALGQDYEEDWDPDNSLIEWFSTNPLYKGVIFIPLNTDYFTATSATGDKISIDQAKLIEAYQQAAQSIQVKDKYVKPGQI